MGRGASSREHPQIVLKRQNGERGSREGKNEMWSRWCVKRKVIYTFMYIMMGKWREGIWKQNKGGIIEGRRDRRKGGPL